MHPQVICNNRDNCRMMNILEGSMLIWQVIPLQIPFSKYLDTYPRRTMSRGGDGGREALAESVSGCQPQPPYAARRIGRGERCFGWDFGQQEGVGVLFYRIRLWVCVCMFLSMIRMCKRHTDCYTSL